MLPRAQNTVFVMTRGWPYFSLFWSLGDNANVFWGDWKLGLRYSGLAFCLSLSSRYVSNYVIRLDFWLLLPFEFPIRDLQSLLLDCVDCEVCVFLNKVCYCRPFLAVLPLFYYWQRPQATTVTAPVLATYPLSPLEFSGNADDSHCFLCV